MLTGRLAEHVEPRELAARSGTLEGWTPLAEFSRLSTLLDRDEGRVRITRAFAEDGEGRPVVRGMAEVPVRVTCQRCLEPVELEVEAKINMVLVRSESEAQEMLHRLDSVVLIEDKIELVALLEDDLILSLPHDACPQGGQGCLRHPAYDHPDGQICQAENPFAVLAKLKGSLSRH
ncbi:MAG: YceD family protein [Pseudomonadales bacterium]